MIEQLQTSSPRIVGFRLSGKWHNAGYKAFAPAVDAALAKEGKLEGPLPGTGCEFGSPDAFR